MKNNAKVNTHEDEMAHIPGAEPSARMDGWWWLLGIVILIIILLITFYPDPYQRTLVFVADGIGLTLFITITAYVITLFVGLLGGLGRLSKNKFIYMVCSIYVEIVRGIPLLVQLIWWYYAFPSLIQKVGESLSIVSLASFKANPVFMAVIGLVVCYGAYVSEIYRAGIQSIPRGQLEAARSLGMSYFQAMQYVILPQAIKVILPPVGNEFISLLKDSSLVSALAITDLTRRGREFMALSFDPIRPLVMVALLYLIMTLLSARIVSSIEKATKFER